MNRSRLLQSLFGLCLLLAPLTARANPRPLPFTYPNETLPKGDLELELYTDVNPLRVYADPADPTQGKLWEPGYILQNEFEYGLTDHVELGFYQVFEATPVDGGTNLMNFDGLKFRVRTRLAEPGELPVDIGLYFELETMHDELSFEEKLNLQKRFGRAAWMANLWVEQELERPLDSKKHGRELEFVINPTTGFTYEVTPAFHPGVEYWARGQLETEGDPQTRRNNRVHHLLGPTIHFELGRLWWSGGLYFNLNSMRAPQPGDTWGPVWFRSVLGMDL